MVGSAELIEQMFDESSQRANIAYGMNQRYKLKPASRFMFRDARNADGVPIMAKRSITPNTINNLLHTPFDRIIVNSKVAYYASSINLTFDERIPQVVQDFYRSLDERASFKSFQLTMAKNCVDQGSSYFLCWIDEYKEFHVAPSPTISTYVMYNTLSQLPEYGFRYSSEICEVYDGIEMTIWSHQNGAWIPGETISHGMGTVSRPMVPIVELRNNPEKLSNPEMTLSLQDAYDISLSDLSSEIGQMRMAYLLTKGLGYDADAIKAQLSEAGVIVADADGDASFISKDLKPDAVRLLQDTLRKLIFEGAASYDPSAYVEGGTPPTAYQVSERLQPLEMDCEITIAEWKMGLRIFDYLIQTHLMMFGGAGEYDINGIDRIFRRVAPRNTLQALSDAKNAGMVLSNQTMIELSGLQIDPAEEMARVESENQLLPDGNNDNTNVGETDTGAQT